MNNRTLFRKWSVFLACFAFCGQQAFAAGGSASPLEITVLVVVILLALLFVLAGIAAGGFLFEKDVCRFFEPVPKGGKGKGVACPEPD